MVWLNKDEVVFGSKNIGEDGKAMSRLLIKLPAKENSAYEMEYNHHIQGLIYRLLSGSKYDNHDKQGYKFFCFSNIFPFNDLRKNDQRNLIISSPNGELISYLRD